MMTFLEYVCHELLGPPNSRGYWCCPFHDDTHPSFHVLPPKGRHRVKYKCFSCPGRQFGDEMDIIKLFHPDKREAEAVWSELRAAFEAGGGEGGVKPTSPTSRGALHLRGRGPASDPCKPAIDKAKAMLIWDELTPDERAVLMEAVMIADRHSIDLQPLAEMALPAAEREAKEEHRKQMERARRCIKPHPVNNRKPRP